MSCSNLKLENFVISLEAIKVATDNFNPKNIIGVGGFGKVYKGELSDRIVAVKCLDPDGFQGKHQFMTELQMLSTFHNKNIIAFIGYCDEKTEMIIVYEYAHNQSLDFHLENTQKMRLITWTQRLNICIGAAQGLDYLHSGLGEHSRIIHRDVKSANILLDEYLEAKISDFGLSRVGPRNQQDTQVHTRVVGTDYYLDPHYCLTRTLTKESDVFSLGVVLFEILCGRLVFPENDWSLGLVQLVLWHKDANDGLRQLIDPHIKNQIGSASLHTFTEIAYECIRVNNKERPPMAMVVKKLEETLQLQEDHDLKELIQKDIYSIAAAETMERNALKELIEREIYSFVWTRIKADKAWEKRMLHEYKEIIEMSDAHVTYDNPQEIYSILSHGILIDGGKKWFSISKLNGKNCVAISAMELFDENDSAIIGWETIKGSRFIKVPNVGKPKHLLDIKIKVSMHMLSLETTYVVYLIYKTSSGQSVSMDILYEKEKFNASSTEQRGDEWRELELFHFTANYLQDFIQFRFTYAWWSAFFDDLHIEGIEFRPIDMWFWLERTNGKICSMLSSKMMRIEHIGGESTFKTSKNKSSRFSNVKVMKKVSSLEIEGHVKAHMLSPMTPYAAWLVFKEDWNLSSYNNNFAWLRLGEQKEKTRKVYLGDRSKMVRPINDPNIEDGVRVNLQSKNIKLDRRQKTRDDDWMEVELFQFINHIDDVKVGLVIKDSQYLELVNFEIQGIEFRPQGN